MTAEPETGLPPTALASLLLARVRHGIIYANSRGRRFRRKASLIRLTTLMLSATSTVILGLQDLNLWASIAFSMVALTTLAGAVEPFFNWRARWIVMEDMQGHLHRLEDDLTYFLARANPEELQAAHLDEFHTRLQDIWADSSRAWIESRRSEGAAQGEITR